jgi:CBS domain-containing protein
MQGRETAMPRRLIRTIIEQQQTLCATPDMTVSAAAVQMATQNVGAIMVVEHDRLVGIFTERDALYRVLAQDRDARTTRLADVMTHAPQTVDPDKPFGYALLMMYENGYRHVPVVEDGRPIGIVSSRDALGPELQDFVSEAQRREHIGEIL